MTMYVHQALIENGANPNAGDYDNRTALHLAASNGETSVLDYLLRKLGNVNVNPLDRLGGTPLDDAHRHANSAAVAMLEAAGGLRKDHPAITAMEESMRESSEQIQRQERRGKVDEKAQASTEIKTGLYVRNKCGKQLTGLLHDLKAITAELLGAMTKMDETMQHFLTLASAEDTLEPFRMSSRDAVGGGLSEDTLHKALKSQWYPKIVDSAREVSGCVRQWRTTSNSASAVMGEELPQCRAINIFSKPFQKEVTSLCVFVFSMSHLMSLLVPVMRRDMPEAILNDLVDYKLPLLTICHQVKVLLHQSIFVSKVLQFLRFLILKIPEVRHAEEQDEKHRRLMIDALLEGEMKDSVMQTW